MIRQILCTALLLLPVALFGQADSTQHFNLHFQTTYINQYKPSFHARYSGPRSLTAAEEKQNSLTATMYLGARLWKGAAIYINPELAGGSGLSGASGMGGSTNGETFRVGNPSPTLYLARAYFTQTFALGNSTTEMAADAANQVAVRTPADYIRLIAGKLSLADLFDNNRYSNSPRSQMINWALMNNGAWDFAANVRGYTYVLGAMMQQKSMSYRLAFAALPTSANGSELETDFSKSLSVNAEVARSFRIRNRAANLRLLGYYNRAPMGSYATAMSSNPANPDVTATRKEGNGKLGLGINGDYELSDVVGLFTRLGWNDGKKETWCFTEIDRTLSLGLSVNGKKWQRSQDQAGVAFVVNGLSAAHRNYLAMGGNGFVLGDGQLNYAAESIAELYYNWQPSSKMPLYIGGDYQFCLNPGYNKDRGPVHVFSLRVHVEL